jgi:hypothetical protein
MNPGYERNLFRAMRLSSGNTNALINSPPEMRAVDIRALQNMARDESLINALNSREVEGRVAPDILRVRDELPRQIAADLEGGPSQRLSNQWLRQGLTDAIATGAMTDSGFARSAIADNTRQSFFADRDRQQAKAAALLSDNPAPIAGLDPGALATATQTAKTANADARDAWKMAIMNSRAGDASNWIGALQQGGQMAAARATDLASATNAARAGNQAFWGQMIGSGMQAAGSVAGAYAGNQGGGKTYPGSTQAAPSTSSSVWSRAMNGAQIGMQDGSIGGLWGMLGGAVGGAADGAFNGPIYQWRTGQS